MAEPMVTIGTIGHRGHGKTTLTAAITKVLSLRGGTTSRSVESIDNLAEERRRGMSIAVREVTFHYNGRQYRHYDCPGSPDHIGRVSSYAAQMDAAILVVSAPDGPMPQTREYVSLAQSSGIPRLVVFLNKSDMMDDLELQELIELEIREMLDEYGFAGDIVPVIPGSALAAMESRNTNPDAIEYVPIWELLRALDAYPVADPARSAAKVVPSDQPRQAARFQPPPQTSEVVQSGRIFISYRRDDAAGFAGRLYDRLADNFGQERLFMDIDAIEPGEDFVEVINRELDSCAVLLAIIGPGWLSAAGNDGRPRLENPDDFVRLEIGKALERNIRIIPILWQRAPMPRSTELPQELASLSRRNAVEVDHASFQRDISPLINTLEKLLGD